MLPSGAGPTLDRVVWILSIADAAPQELQSYR